MRPTTCVTNVVVEDSKKSRQEEQGEFDKQYEQNTEKNTSRTNKVLQTKRNQSNNQKPLALVHKH